MKEFKTQDTVTTEIIVTDGFFDGGVGTVGGSSFTTSSLSAAQKSYYYNLQYSSKDHFSCTYGHIHGSGSENQSATREGTTQAIYKQFYNMTETDRGAIRNSQGWIINSVTQSDAYVMVAERLQMKDRLNPGTWTIVLSGSNSSTTGSELSLTDNSKTTSPSAAPFGERYDIVSGSAGSVHSATQY